MGNDNNNNTCDSRKLVPQRWVQLAYLSLLALLSDWVCFSVAAAPSTFESNFEHSAASIIDIFLFTNVATSFLVTDIVAKFGLQRAIQGAAIFMTTGCWLRSGFNFIPNIFLPSGGGEVVGNVLVDYPFIVAGTVLVGIAQPFFQCTPPLLSAKWFANNERSTSTAIALNFNQIGIATAFLVGGAMATNAEGLENYFGVIACMTTLVTVGTLLQFENEPPIPPSTSELEKLIKGEEEPPFIESIQTFFANKGFSRPLAAFICSIAITNVVGAFIDDVMERGGVTGQFQIDLAGAGFELAIVAGGIILGGFVDKTKEYKKVTMFCLAATALLVLPLGLTDHYLGREPLLLVLALLGLGMAAGPIQPINAELAVDITYPGDETAVESVQQIGGNLVSALLIPVAEAASKSDYTLLRGVPGLESDIRGDVVLLIALAFITLIFFSSFDAPLARTIADEAADSQLVSFLDSNNNAQYLATGKILLKLLRIEMENCPINMKMGMYLIKPP
ncbi:MFS general substrate transporter [Fragilariopsis cylindrus CCMP1102]|uniref:MFS general substrate transporter n=1 Tax=Fragilariopsis cylindrus CCMP1102 TaxID=635003 RepID=A0A1E7F219_9STRA|nr:MFS general substrate transporter [Fragilariopsis cylindrus CCMP1102]|eukprot:OEU12271.1 MFS general substrate transporter [Fragilariopsis cylindrus CCMP1102]